MKALIIFNEMDVGVHLIEKSVTNEEVVLLTRFQDHYINDEDMDYALFNEMTEYFYDDDCKLQMFPREKGVIINAHYDYIFHCGYRTLS